MPLNFFTTPSQNKPPTCMMFDTQRFYRNLVYLACSKAYTSKIVKGRHCAIILDEENNIVSTFVNCMTCDGKASIHAEVGAVQSLCSSDIEITKEFTLMVVRVNLLGEITLSKPCKNCEDTVRESGIGTCMYTTNEYNKLDVVNFN